MTKKNISFKAALLFPNRIIAHLHSQIEQQQQVLERVCTILPATLAAHALHCVINGKKLFIYTDAATWASQLRFYNSAILAAIAPVTRESISIMQIKVISELASTNAQPTRKPLIPSAEKIEFIRNHSLTVQDEQLKLALLKLSATLARLSSYKAG